MGIGHMLKQYHWKNYSFLLLFTVMFLCALGTMFIYAAKPEFVTKQLLGVILCFFTIIVISLIDYHFILKFIWPLYFANIIILACVKLFGKNVGGATRWFDLGPLGTIQPSEFSKIILILFVAYYIERHKEEFHKWKTLFKLACYCFGSIVLILIETDLSTSIDITLILCSMVFIAGIHWKKILTIIGTIIPCIGGLLFYAMSPNPKFIPPYMINRIRSFVDPSQNHDAGAYQQINSVMAIGSGQLKGKGLFSDSLGTVRDAKLVSEQQTDFIFSIVGEMTGFIGCLFVIVLLLFIALQCIGISRKAKDISGQLIAIGIGSLFCFQSFLNIGVATQILPNTGLPLPFVSYGLSSLMGSAIGIGLVINIGLQRRKF